MGGGLLMVEGVFEVFDGGGGVSLMQARGRKQASEFGRGTRLARVWGGREERWENATGCRVLVWGKRMGRMTYDFEKEPREVARDSGRTG
jgi:hypothetical protein